MLQQRELRLSNAAHQELLRATIERGASLRTTVRGFSMSPFIKDGDVLTIAPMDQRAPRVGEVIAFVSPLGGRMAVHRVVSRQNDGWLLRGDNSTTNDGVLDLEDMLGRVVRVERDGRDVQLGVGAGGVLIARLNRGRGLTGLKAVWRLPRRVAAFIVRMAQGTKAYAAIGAAVVGPVEIAQATEADLAVVHGRAALSAAQRDWTDGPTVTCWVARRDSKVVGYVQYVFRAGQESPWAGHWLFSLAVSPRYRGLGIGESLTRHVVAHARAQNAPELRLAVFDDNDRAIRLYKKLGFAHVVLPSLEPLLVAEAKSLGRRRVVMQLDLSAPAHGEST